MEVASRLLGFSEEGGVINEMGDGVKQMELGLWMGFGWSLKFWSQNIFYKSLTI